MFKLLCWVLLIQVTFQNELTTSMKILNWKRPTFVTRKASHSFVKTLKNEEIFWKFEQSLSMTDSNHNVVLLDGQTIPKILNKYPFSFIVMEETLSDLDFSNAPLGFYLMKNGSLHKCFVLSNEKRNNFQKCFDAKAKILDFEGFPLRALYSDAADGDHLVAQRMLDQITKKLNLTIEYQLADDPTEWGASPKLGCNFSTIECFDGVFHQFVTENFDFQLNIWNMIHERIFLVDYLTPYFIDSYALYINDKLVPDKYDWSFYLRPFEKSSWIVTFLTFSVFFTLRFIFSYNSAMISKTGTTTLGWMVYVLIFAYYSGAQTMFLSTPKDIYIKNLDDVLLSKEWKVAVPKGYELIISRYLHKEHFQKFRKELTEGYEHNYDNIGETIEAMKKVPGLAMPFPQYSMNSYLNNKNIENPFIKRGKLSPAPMGPLLNRGWPLKSLFNKEINKLRGLGILDELLKPFQGKSHESKAESQFSSVNFKDVITAFGLLTVLSISSLLTFLLEIVFQKFH